MGRSEDFRIGDGVFEYIGELAALGGSCCWATCSVFFTESVKRITVWTLNLVRMLFAVGFLSLTLWLFTGSPLVVGVSFENWFWLGLSSLAGLALGDLCYFSALGIIGPRLGLLLMSLAPPIATVEGLFLGERMGLLAIVGMLLVVSGVCWVVTEQKTENVRRAFHPSLKGILLGLGGATGQATGLVFSKVGLTGISPLTGSFMRMMMGSLLFATILLLTNRWRLVRESTKNRRGYLHALIGAFFGPFIGVTLSLVAAKFTDVGVAMTLLSTTPLTILPFSALVYKEKMNIRAVVGACIAVFGVFLLFLR